MLWRAHVGSRANFEPQGVHPGLKRPSLGPRGTLESKMGENDQFSFLGGDPLKQGAMSNFIPVTRALAAPLPVPRVVPVPWLLAMFVLLESGAARRAGASSAALAAAVGTALGPADDCLLPLRAVVGAEPGGDRSPVS